MRYVYAIARDGAMMACGEVLLRRKTIQRMLPADPLHGSLFAIVVHFVSK